MADYSLRENAARPYIEGDPSRVLIARDSDALEVVGACAELGANRVLLEAASLADAFFDLKTRLAGEVLQRLVNYHVRLALVLESTSAPGGRFAEMVEETERQRNRHFRAFASRDDAIDWLTAD